MNKLFFLTLLLAGLCLGGAPAALATTFRVNNNLTSIPTARLYTTLSAAQSAVTNATAGDTLLVEGSGIEYVAFTCTKRLTIIGPGYLLTQNSQNQANALPATVQGITFSAGSEYSAIIGLTFSTGSTGYYPAVNVNNISVIRCYLTNGIAIGATINNLLILQNYLQRFGIQMGSTGYAFGNVILKNNIIVSELVVAQYSGAPRIFSVVENNIFGGNVTLNANSFANNIIASAAAAVSITAASTGNLFTAAGQLPATGNTQATATSLFVGLAAAANSTDGQYRLSSSAAYPTTGATQPGVFGGSEPYVLSGIPAIPTIYSLRADAVGSKQNGLNVTIGARGNP
jgi:hypothetical protein